ncbi:unnamed protein product [Didymodactylos carnosus]|nr:unnamed protein product [Didymodactylos carnosus]
MKQVIDEKDSCITHISKTQETVKQELSSIRQKVEDLQSISYDGICTWKITNASEKMADAQSERQTSICSPPFYSSPTGYKMRMRLCLHGDGNARKTHLSLFFVLMRGDYDEILKWPFNFKVTFCLYDQSDQQRHIINSFRPDVTSNSFQRPKTQMNVEFGFPKFYPLPEMLQDGNNYMKDDTIFLKCLIDDRPKDILAYALRLNPGLPFHTQQELIQQSIEKRQEQQRQTLNYPLRNNMAPSPTSNDSAEWENHVSATDENVEEAICISRVYSVHSAATSTNLVDSSSNEET